MLLSKQRQNIVVFFFILLVFVFIRLPYIANPISLNPDEAELIASGRRAMLDLVPYKTFTTSTSGVWWPLFLGWLGRLGFPLNLKGAHFLSAFLGATICFCFYLILKRQTTTRSSVMITLLIALPWASGFSLFSGEYPRDFSALATALLPLTFLAVSVVLFRMADTKSSLYYWALFFAGLAIFSKYHFLLVGLFVAGVIYWKLSRVTGKYVRSFCLSLCCLLIPTLLVFLIAAIFNRNSYSYREPLYLAIDYLSARSTTANEVSILRRMSDFVSTIWAFPSLLLAALLVLAGDASSKVVTSSTKGSDLLTFVKVSSGFSIGALSVTIPGTGFAHYLHLLIAGLLITFMFLNNEDQDRSKAKSNPLNSFALFLVLVLCIISFTNQILGTQSVWSQLKNAVRLDKAQISLETISSPVEEKIPSLCPPKSKVLVWGWSADLYSYYDWVPATRYTIQSGMITGSTEPWNSLAGDMRRQISAELFAKHPICILNAVGPGFFPYVFSNPQKIQYQLSGARQFLEENYVSYLIPTNAVGSHIYGQEGTEVYVLKQDSVVP